MEQITESSEVLLDSDVDHDLTTALSNTRSLSEDKTYDVKDVTIQESTQILSLFTSLDDRAQLQFHPQELTLDTKEITSTAITQKHLREYPNNTEFSSIQPIDPFVAETPSGDEVTLYFAQVQTKYIVQIQLKSENGERQTVYKQYSKQWEAERLQRVLQSRVQLNISNDTIVLETLSQDPDTVIGSLRSRLNEHTEDNLGTVLGLVVLTISTAIMSLNISPTITQLSLIVATVTIFSLVALDESESSGTTETGPFTETVQLEYNSVEVSTVDPTTTVTVETRFTEDELELSLANNNQDIIWSYPFTDQGVFTKEEIVEFYTELGFNKSETREFTAYLSTKDYEDTVSLSETNTENPLYLYPEDPQSST